MPYLPDKCKSFSPYYKQPEDINNNSNTNQHFEIKEEDFSEIKNKIKTDKITSYEYHPVMLRNDYLDKINKVIMPIPLTKEERKKNRRLKRLEKEQYKQERQKLGLIKPEKPKLKYELYYKIINL